MTQRAMISCIMGISMKLRRATMKDRRDDFTDLAISAWYVLYRIDNNEVVAWIHEDNIFDRDGNHFENNE